MTFFIVAAFFVVDDAVEVVVFAAGVVDVAIGISSVLNTHFGGRVEKTND